MSPSRTKSTSRWPSRNRFTWLDLSASEDCLSPLAHVYFISIHSAPHVLMFLLSMSGWDETVMDMLCTLCFGSIKRNACSHDYICVVLFTAAYVYSLLYFCCNVHVYALVLMQYIHVHSHLILILPPSTSHQIASLRYAYPMCMPMLPHRNLPLPICGQSGLMPTVNSYFVEQNLYRVESVQSPVFYEVLMLHTSSHQPLEAVAVCEVASRTAHAYQADHAVTSSHHSKYL